jgi:aminoglycoside phosphotransferase (APT) family kinase protein
VRPGHSQLIDAMRSEIHQAASDSGRVDIPTMLDGIQVCLNELAFRGDRDYFRGFLAEGGALVGAAHRVLGETAPVGEPDDVDTVLAESAAVTARLLARNDDAASALARQIVDWELGLYARRLETADPRDALADGFARLTADNFRTYLAARRPDWPNLKVTSFQRQPGGYSKITVLVGLEDDANGAHGVVIRAQPARTMLDLDGMSVAAEFPVVRFAFNAGLPVAEPILLEEDPRHIGFAFMLSRRMPGTPAGSFVGASGAIDESQVRDVLALAARIANTPVDPDDPLIRQSHLGRWLKHDTLKANTREFIEYWRDVGTRGNSLPSALLNYAVHWLLENIPQDEVRPNLIHGDVGFHNILYDDGRISALLDWENSRFGDTAEELSMFVSSIAHLYDHQTILGWYHAAGGPPVSEYRLRYFDVYMTMKIIVSAQVSIQRVQENPESNLRLGVFGIRFLHMIGSRLQGLIALAEAARDAERAVSVA